MIVLFLKKSIDFYCFLHLFSKKFTDKYQHSTFVSSVSVVFTLLTQKNNLFLYPTFLFLHLFFMSFSIYFFR